MTPDEERAYVAQREAAQARKIMASARRRMGYLPDNEQDRAAIEDYPRKAQSDYDPRRW